MCIRDRQKAELAFNGRIHSRQRFWKPRKVPYAATWSESSWNSTEWTTPSQLSYQSARCLKSQRPKIRLRKRLDYLPATIQCQFWCIFLCHSWKESRPATLNMSLRHHLKVQSSHLHLGSQFQETWSRRVISRRKFNPFRLMSFLLKKKLSQKKPHKCRVIQEDSLLLSQKLMLVARSQMLKMSMEV